MNIGFSTGSIALGDFRKAIDVLNRRNGNVIELSALRENELAKLIEAIDDLELKKFEFISVHAPSKYTAFTELTLVNYLKPIAERGWPVIVHPDIIVDFKLWKTLGSSVCLENMDKRKNVGRTTEEMEILFDQLPDATFCFDIAHVRQVDPTLMEGIEMIKKLKNKLIQLHVSEVNSESKHFPLTFESIIAFHNLSFFIPKDIPVVLESPVNIDSINSEIEKASMIFNPQKLMELLIPFTNTSTFFYKKVAKLKGVLSEEY